MFHIRIHIYIYIEYFRVKYTHIRYRKRTHYWSFFINIMCHAIKSSGYSDIYFDVSNRPTKQTKNIFFYPIIYIYIYSPKSPPKNPCFAWYIIFLKLQSILGTILSCFKVKKFENESWISLLFSALRGFFFKLYDQN